MKIFIVHVFVGCCANNSDGKIWVTAKDEEMARVIVKQKTNYPITKVEEFDLENEVVFSSFDDFYYRLKGQTDDWGYLPEEYVKEHHMDKTFLESWQREHQWD